MNRGYTYIASPYSHSEQVMRVFRYEAVLKYTAYVFKLENFAFSPIVHCHELAVKYTLPTDAAFWNQYNRCMLERAESLSVLCLSDWEKSLGVTEEIQWAWDLKLPVWYVHSVSYAMSKTPAWKTKKCH